MMFRINAATGAAVVEGRLPDAVAPDHLAFVSAGFTEFKNLALVWGDSITPKSVAKSRS